MFETLRALEAIRDTRSGQHAELLAQAIVCTQAELPQAFLDEMAAILRFAHRYTGISCAEYLQGRHFLNYSGDARGVLRYSPARWRHGAREFLGD